jgi:hypothetical protein
VCGNSFAASPVNCNVHAFSAGEGGQGAGAFVMMNSSKKHDSVQVSHLNFCVFPIVSLVNLIFAGPQLLDDCHTHAATARSARLALRAVHVAVA